jgi:hypothetical protein
MPVERHELVELHYVTLISSVLLICELGILSHRRATGVDHESIAMDEIQERRAKVVVPGGRPLHHYANLYICARNPMLYKRRNQHERLCVLRIDPKVVDLDGVVITNANASSPYVRFAPAPEGLKIVNRELTFANDWTCPHNPIEYYRRKSAKCAEVLVPDRVHPEFLVGAYASCEESLTAFHALGVNLPAEINKDLFFVYFPTKDHWRSVSRLEDIAKGLEYLERHCQEWGITSLAVPPLGCGQGQLEWRVVGPTLYRYLKRLSIPVELYAPFETPHRELRLAFLEQPIDAQEVPASRIAPAWVALVVILDCIEREPYHWPVGRTIFQKIAYFATESGIPTGLEYQRSSFGPYTPKLKSVTTKLVNNGLTREERLGRMFAVRVGPTFKDALKLCQTEVTRWHGAMERVTDLFTRMRTTRQAELAATVHFAAKSLAARQGGKLTESEVLSEVMEWKQRRRPPLSEEEVALTIRYLGVLEWLDVKPSSSLPVGKEALLDV